MAGFSQGTKDGLEATIRPQGGSTFQGALDLETFQFTFCGGEKIRNAQTTKQMLAKFGAQQPKNHDDIHVFVGQCPLSFIAKILQPWSTARTPG